MLRGKNILLGVCGSISAYKAALITRLLVKQQANVQVIMTPSSIDFITSLTLSTLSKRPALSEFTKKQSGQWNNHVELGLWADVFLIAPASANSISKFAQGLCDNLLSAAYLSARCPVYIAPAMDLDMWLHPSTQHNIKLLQSYGNTIIPPESGELASGLTGTGRLAEPEEIVKTLVEVFTYSTRLKGKTVLVTAGPTFEAIDPVRFIGNHSSGKMGFALAEELALQGAQVELVSGPTHLSTHSSSIKRTDVISAADMHKVCIALFEKCDIAICSAAVADYRPHQVAGQKIKKQDQNLNLQLTKTTDILAELGKLKKNGQLLIGFALETEQEQENALAKLRKKNLDLIILNSLKDKGAGFGTDTNRVTLIDRDEHIESLPLKPKPAVAKDIVNKIVSFL